MCGDEVEVRLSFSPDRTVADVAFEGRGCAISLASADLMAEVVQGRTEQELRALADAFGILAKTGDTECADTALAKLRPLSGVSEYPSRVKCATLPWRALITALDSHQGGAG